METIEKAAKILEDKLIEFKSKTASKEDITGVETALKSLRDTEVKELQTKLETAGATIEKIVGEVKELKAARGRIGGGRERRESIMSSISDKILEHKDAFIEAERSGRVNKTFEIKAPGPILSTSLANGSYIDYLDWRQGMEPTGQFRIRELIRTVASAFDTVFYPRANSPVGQGSFGRQVNEGDTKAQVDRGYTMATLTLKPIAAYVQVSRQSLRNIPFLQTWLPTSLNEQLLDTEDIEFINTLVSAATGDASLIGRAGALTVTAERFIHLITNAKKKKFNPNGIACDPNVWEDVLLTKPQNYSTPLGYVVDSNGVVKILGVPLYPVNWLNNNRVMCADWTKAMIVESEGLSFRQSDNVASTFIQNEITFLLERTNGMAIPRPDAFQTTVFS